MVTHISFLIAIVAGMMTFFSPCVLPLMPVYISLITGLSFKESPEKKEKISLTEIIFPTLSFILGVSVIFISLGASISAIGKFFLKGRRLFQIIGGSIVVIFGLHLSGIIKLRFLEFEKKFQMKRKARGIFGPFLLGTIFAFGWTPCVDPILAGILTYAAFQKTVAKGILLLSFYSLGFAIPFFITGLTLNFFFSFFRRISKYHKIILAVSGSILILMGILLISGQFGV